ncbi:MAG: pilus assembly protein [Caulobacteraceae bacterium]|nr:pilus assembly protein [Caulobacteraceae bacterium]
MIRSLLIRFRRDRRGVSAVEFALIAPLLISTYFALAVLSGAMMAERKASHVASAIGDLVAQSTVLHDADFTDIFSIANTVMAPFDTTSTALKMRVSSIGQDANGAVKVLWSKPQNMTALVQGTTYTGLPAGLISNGQTIILSEVTYTYNSPVSSFVQSIIPNALTFTEHFYLKPRQSDSVTALTP